MAHTEEWEQNPLKELPQEEVSKIIAQNARLVEESESWKRKYEEVFNEQCKTRSLETQLREKLNSAERDRIVLQAQLDASSTLLDKVLDAVLDRMH